MPNSQKNMVRNPKDGFILTVYSKARINAISNLIYFDFAKRLCYIAYMINRHALP